MRLAAQKIGGFYPASPEAVRQIAALIQYTGGPVLDPCAGEGEALQVLAQALGAPPEMLYAIELERERGEALKARLPGSTVLAPCSFFDTKLPYHALTLAYVNPPFDTNVKGGRTEATFMEHATNRLVTGGVVILVIPATEFDSGYQPVVRLMLDCYEQLAILPFPEGHRPFNEVAVIGRKRAKQVSHDNPWDAYSDIPIVPLSECKYRWAPIPRDPLRYFEQTAPTDQQIIEAVGSSPLWDLTAGAMTAFRRRPPLPLGKGHLALLLASGQLDGIVRPEGEPPHVVRGTANKVQCDPEVSVDENVETGATKTTTVIRERIELVVRAAYPDGKIRTFK